MSDTSLNVTVRYFSVCKMITGSETEPFSLEANASVGKLLERVFDKYPDLRELTESVFVAVNYRYVKKSHRLNEGDEVALLPPLAGG